jgi:hypothetical protein
MLILTNVCSEELKTLVGIVKAVLQIIQIVIPIGLIVWGTLDLGKAVIASKEDDIKKAQQLLIKRAITAVLVFLVSAIVMFLMGFVGNVGWKTCWNEASGCDSYNPLTGACCTSGTVYDAKTGTCINK